MNRINRNDFRIVSLSDCVDCNKKNNLRDGGTTDPISIILGSVSIVQGIMGLLGFSGSTPVTAAQWQQAFPANGYWTNKLRSYLANHIKWVSDLGNIQQYTLYFIDENLSAITNGQYVWSQTAGNHATTDQFNTIVSNFYKTLQTEASTSGVGTTNAGFGNLDITTILLIGAGLWFVTTQMGKKPTTRRKKK